MYVFSQHALKLINYVDSERNYEWSKISSDLIPFFARNQFKEKLLKMLDEATKDKTKKKQYGLTQFKDLSDRIDALFNTGSSSQGDAKKLSINVVGHIDTMDSTNAYLRMQNTKAYRRANLEGQKLVSKFDSTKGQYQLDYRLF